MFYVDRLSKFAECIIFEGEQLGGAWSETDFAGVSRPIANNIVCPLSEAEEKFIDDIEKILLSKGAKIFKCCDTLNLAINYVPRQHILGQFITGVIAILKNENVSLRREIVSIVEINNDSVAVNGEKFNAIILPSNFFLPNLRMNDQELEVLYETVVSKHVRVVFSEVIVGPHYSENFDNVFDRGGIMPSSPNTFIGRIRREMKQKNVEEIVGQSKFLQDNVELLGKIEINSYRNHRLDDCALMKLRNSLEGSFAFCIETRQFVDAFSKISISLESIRQKLSIQSL